MYLYELVNWLTTVVDSLQIRDSYKDEAYRGATTYIAQCLMVRPSSLPPSLFRKMLPYLLTRADLFPYSQSIGLPHGP